VRADARPAPSFGWLNTAESCSLTSTGANAITASPAGNPRRVVYRTDDRVAKALAERLVALHGNAIAVGLRRDELAGALRSAGDLGYLLEVPHAPLSPCRALATLYSAAHWLARPDGATMVPLIDVREHAIMKRNGVPATIGWDGTPTFGDPRRRP
jgi:hypothetical protein